MNMPERGLRLQGPALLRLGALAEREQRPRATPRFLAILAVVVSALAAERSLSSPKAEENPMNSKLSVLASAAIASTAFATDRLVPQQYPTIQAAVDASVNGDRVLISPGFYQEAVRLNGKAVFLQGSDPRLARNIILSGAGVPGPAVSAPTGATYQGLVGLADLTVDGLDIYEQDQDAGAIFGSLGPNASIQIRHCMFRRIRGGGAGGVGALFFSHTANTVQVDDCAFFGNSSVNHGEAIYAYDGVNAIARNCTFDNHTIGSNLFYARTDARLEVLGSVVRNATMLSFNHQTGQVFFANNIGCAIGALTAGGYVDGGGNNWNGPCPDCDGDGILDLEEMLFANGDCNGNGLLDACEIPSHPNWDRNNDGIIDACQCIADITGNGTVDGVDLAAVLGAWGSGGGGKAGADIDGDGIVSGTDLAIVLGSWGACP